MTTLTLYGKALEKIVQLQDLFIAEQKEVLRLMAKIERLKVKELTDDEIDKIAKKCDEDEEQGKTQEFWYRNFAKALLLEAQEK